MAATVKDSVSCEVLPVIRFLSAKVLILLKLWIVQNYGPTMLVKEGVKIYMMKKRAGDLMFNIWNAFKSEVTIQNQRCVILIPELFSFTTMCVRTLDLLRTLENIQRLESWCSIKVSYGRNRIPISSRPSISLGSGLVLFGSRRQRSWKPQRWTDRHFRWRIYMDRI